MRFLNIFLAALFFLFAWFQRNDLDPEIYYHPSTLDTLLWLLFYLIIGTVFLLCNHRKVHRLYFTFAITACLIAMAFSGPGLWENLFGNREFSMTAQTMSGKDPRVELTREFFGALLALAAVLFQLWQNRKNAATSPGTEA